MENILIQLPFAGIVTLLQPYGVSHCGKLPWIQEHLGIDAHVWGVGLPALPSCRFARTTSWNNWRVHQRQYEHPSRHCKVIVVNLSLVTSVDRFGLLVDLALGKTDLRQANCRSLYTFLYKMPARPVAQQYKSIKTMAMPTINLQLHFHQITTTFLNDFQTYTYNIHSIDRTDGKTLISWL